jgi:DNA-binding NtrC family response regulator
MTAHMSVETVAKSITSGAVEYLGKPLLIDDLLAVVRKVQATRSPAQDAAQNQDEGPESSIIGRTPKMLEVYRAVARVAPTDVSVLILGPSGTGKELVARAIHDHSSRAKMPFVPVNCGALPENILESELFGHEKGAFTGADSSRPGLFEAAHGGTLFLDEISETRPSFQVNLLRAVQEQQIRRVGSHKYTPVNVRILAASNRDLTKMMAAGQFREDLYYRLSVVEIKLPSLDERREDIPLLVQHFLKRSNLKNKRSVKITDEAVSVLSTASWPGNVRELENLVERLAIFCTSGEIGVADVESERRVVHGNGAASGAAAAAESARTLEDMERQHIMRVLEENGGNKSRAARALGIERKTLYQKARRLGIDLQVER